MAARRPKAPAGPSLFDTGRAVQPTEAPAFTAPARPVPTVAPGLSPAEHGAALWRASMAGWRGICRAPIGSDDMRAAVAADEAASAAWREWAAFEDDETVRTAMRLVREGSG